MKIIAGLGNPGREYENTRHNTGFVAIDRIAGKLGIQVIRAKHKGLIGENIFAGEKLMLLKPMTFMNLCGECIREAIDYYNLSAEDLIVIYDDESLPVGAVRARESGSDGGHNGVKSIISHLATQDFKRVRIGIGHKPEGWDLADYVLGRFQESEKADIENAVCDAADCAMLMLEGKVREAMNKYNKRLKSEPEDVL